MRRIYGSIDPWVDAAWRCMMAFLYCVFAALVTGLLGLLWHPLWVVSLAAGIGAAFMALGEFFCLGMEER
jgi:hypothetical protein